MSRGNLKRTIVAGLLGVCLMLALAGAAEAWQPSHPDQTEVTLEEEVSFWHELWQRFETFWNLRSVLVIPEG